MPVRRAVSRPGAGQGSRQQGSTAGEAIGQATLFSAGQRAVWFLEATAPATILASAPEGCEGLGMRWRNRRTRVG